ncbi:hypothetical protein FO519_007295 [Halicephalobus sp. NKZ332]|nr:hypothetical protein FO519_007295 [Halicephalobus sp. NKZ332]
MKNLKILSFGVIFFLLVIDGFVDGEDELLRAGRRKGRRSHTTPGLLQGVYNAGLTALEAILSIPGIIWNSIFHNQPRMLRGLPRVQGKVPPLNDFLQIKDSRAVNSFSDFLKNPNLSKQELNSKIEELKKGSPEFSQKMGSIEASEAKDYEQLLSKLQHDSEITQLTNEVKKLHENQQIGLGKETLSIMEKLMNAEESQKSKFCKIVEEFTKGKPQFTTRGSASVSAACQALDLASELEAESSESNNQEN